VNLVFLFGPPAAGKLTVGRELAHLTGFALFHNHLIVDAVAAVFPFGSDAFVRLRQEFWLRVIAEAAAADRSLIFTFAPEPTVPADFVPEVQRAVTARGGLVHFVHLTCSVAEQDRRIDNADRARFGKLRARDILAQLRADPGSAWTGPVDFSIDTVAHAPADAARAIIAHFALVQPRA
jgi:hypothetical protein